MSAVADLVIANANVRTLDRHETTGQAIAVASDRILAIGRNDVIDALRGPSTTVLDAGGQTILPAFTDSHTHFKRSTVVRAFFIDFREVRPKDLADVLAAVAAKAAMLQADAWVQGDGLNDIALAEGRFPTRQDLTWCPGVGPWSCAASVATSWPRTAWRCGSPASTGTPSRQPVGGSTTMTTGSRPASSTSRASRLDMTLADTVIPRFGPDDRVAALEAGMTYLHRHGMAGIHEMAREPDEIGDYLDSGNAEGSPFASVSTSAA